MTSKDLQRGGGYVYQWNCAILLALNYLMDKPEIYDEDLHKLITDFLGKVESVQLEEQNSEENNSTKLDDINLIADSRKVIIQVKAKDKPSFRWTPSNKELLMALYKFYCNEAIGQKDSDVRFVFLSNRGFNPDLNTIRGSINAGTLLDCPKAKTLFEYLQNYVDKNESHKEPHLDFPHFLRLLANLCFVNFLAIDVVSTIIGNHLKARCIGNAEQDQESLFTEFTNRSVKKGGSRLNISDLYEIVPELFGGNLIDYIIEEPHRTIARNLLEIAQQTSFPPLETCCTLIIKKIEMIINHHHKALNHVEAFVLLIATCLPCLLHRFDLYTGEEINNRKIQKLIDKFEKETSVDPEVRSRLLGVGKEITNIANVYWEINSKDHQHNDVQIQNTRVRVRLLAAVLRLAVVLNLDQFVDPKLPSALENACWDERLKWWEQAYVFGVDMENQRLKISFRLPQGLKKEYVPILVDPLDEQIRTLISEYDQILHSEGVNLNYLGCEISEDDVPALPEDDWRKLKQKFEIVQARKLKGLNQLNNFRVNRQCELLVSEKIQQAECMVVEKRPGEAAKEFANIATILESGGEFAQSKQFAIKAAEQYLETNDQLSAARQYLAAAQVWLESTFPPQLASSSLEQASKISSELEDPILKIEVLIVMSWAAFANMMDQEAEKYLEQAKDFLQGITNQSQKAKLLNGWAIKYATLSMVWEEWESAQNILTWSLDACPDGEKEELLNLSQQLLLVGTERGDWIVVDQVYQETLKLLDGLENPERRGLNLMHYGASLVRRGDLNRAYDVYSDALQNLEGESDAYTLRLAYQNMEYMLLVNGFLEFPGLGEHDIRRLDLFQRTKTENRGYSHEMRAALNITGKNYLEAIQNARLALAYYWHEGALEGIDTTYSILALIYAETNKPEEALLSAIRTSNIKLVEEYSEVILDKGDSDQLNDVVGKLVQKWPAALIQGMVVKALGILSDVIPPTMFDRVTSLLVDLLQGPENNQVEIRVRRNTAEALKLMAPQFNKEQANTIVEIVLNELIQRSHWTVTEEFLKLLEVCFHPTWCKIENDLYLSVADAMLNFDGFDHSLAIAQRVSVQMAKKGPHCVRSKVINYLSSQPENLNSIIQLTILCETVPEDHIHTQIEKILNEINPKVPKIGPFKIRIPNISPRAINEFNKFIPSDMHNEVIDGLLEAIINEHNHMFTKSDAVWSLSELPSQILISRSDEIAQYLLLGEKGELPRSKIVEMGLESQKNPFSTFRLNMGNVEHVRRSCLRALGKLYPHYSFR